MPNCFLFAAGERTKFTCEISSDDLVIAVDGGWEYAVSLGIRPDILIGDFDSLSVIPPGVQTIKLPVEKDVTDTMAAIDYGLAKGFASFQIYGGQGGRLDHTLANVACLEHLARRGAHGFLYGNGFATTAVVDSFCLNARKCGTVSVFALGGRADGVYIDGLKYTLANATLTTDFPIGVSNEFVGSPAKISVKEGILLVIFPV